MNFFARAVAMIAIAVIFCASGTPARAGAGACAQISFGAGATYGSTCTQTLPTTQNDDHLASTAFVNSYFEAYFASNLTDTPVAPIGAPISRTLIDHLGEWINLSDYAPHDAIGWNDATMALGSNQMCSASATFTAADVGKSITIAAIGTVNTGGNSAQGNSMWGTIATVPSAHCVTVTFAAGLPTTAQFSLPYYSMGNCKVSAAGINYNAGDLVYPTLPITGSVPQSCQVIDSTVVQASVINGGSGVTGATGGADGADGTCTIQGTSGTLRQNARPNFVNLTATVVGGSVTAVSIITGGDYIVNPNTINSVTGLGTYEPVNPSSSVANPCTGLTGATLSMQTGMLKVLDYNFGIYATKLPGNGSASYPVTTNGAGINGTLTFIQNQQLGGQYTYGTDSTAGIAKAFAVAESDAAMGMRIGIYAPGGECQTISNGLCVQSAYSGAYYVGGATLPYLTYGEAFLGAERHASIFYMAPSYGGALLGWSQHTQSGASSAYGSTMSLSMVRDGPSVGNITIIGDMTSPNPQIGVAFYDRGNFADVHDLDVFFVPGQALCLSCADVTGSVGNLRESYFSKLRFFYTGALGKPNLDVASYNTNGGGSGVDDLYFNQVTICGPVGPGVVVHASHGAGMGEIFFSELRVEGLAGPANSHQGDLVQVGDNSVVGGITMDGTINNVYFDGVQLIDPYFGSWAFHTVATSTAAEPYSIYASHVNIGGGSPYGGGVAIDWCKNCSVSGASESVLGVDFQVGPSTQTSAPIILDFPSVRGLQTYDTNIDPTSSYLQAAFVAGNLNTPSGNLALSSILLGSTTGTTQAPGVAELVGGIVPASELPAAAPATTQNNTIADGTSCTASPGTLTAEYSNVGSLSTGGFLVLSSLQHQEIWNSNASTITICPPAGAAIAGYASGVAIAAGGHGSFTFVTSTLIMPGP